MKLDIGKLLSDAIAQGVKSQPGKAAAPQEGFVPHDWELEQNDILAGLKDQGYTVQMMTVPFDKGMKGAQPGSDESLRVLIGPPGTDFGSSRSGGFNRLEGLYDAGGPFMVHPSIVDNEAVMRALKRYRKAKPKLAAPVNLPGLDLSR